MHKRPMCSEALCVSLHTIHIQYKILLMFSYKTTFERERRPHTPANATFSFID